MKFLKYLIILKKCCNHTRQVSVLEPFAQSQYWLDPQWTFSLNYFVCLQNLSDNPTIANKSDKECGVMTPQIVVVVVVVVDGNPNQSIKLAPLPGWEFNVFLFKGVLVKGQVWKKKKKKKKKHSLLLLSTTKKKEVLKRSIFFQVNKCRAACLFETSVHFIQEYTPGNPPLYGNLPITYLHGEHASW